MRPHLAALPAPSGHPGVARVFDVIVLTGKERKGHLLSSGPGPQAVLAIGWSVWDAHLHIDYERELVPLFFKVRDLD